MRKITTFILALLISFFIIQPPPICQATSLVITRASKGSALTWTEMDTNLTNLDAAIAGLQTAPTFITSITTPSVLATANDSGALGASGTAFSDLFLASGGVINWAAGDTTLTHSTGLLTSNVPLSLGTSNALTAGSIELGAAADTTITRTGAGAIAVEGAAVLTSAASGIQTFLTTPSSANLAAAVTDETGTGKLVLDTAPTFTTSIATPSVLATANDSGAIGASGTAFSDLFLASGGVINWAAGDTTLTHSTGLLTSNVPLSLGTSNALTAGSIELGAAADTTITRTGTGAIAVEGTPVLTSSATGIQTFLTTPSSANLAAAVTDETGTGKLVLDTAPTFTTSIATPSVLATANDSGALGASGTAFSDLFLASGGVINWAAGNATLTHSTGLLTSNVPLSLQSMIVESAARPVIELFSTGASAKARIFQATAVGRIDIGANIYYDGAAYQRDDINKGSNLTSYTDSGTINMRVCPAGSGPIALINGLFINNIGHVGIGTITPTARLHLPASTATADEASLKIDAGVVATTPVSGNIESDGTHLYWTDSTGTRKQLDN